MNRILLVRDPSATGTPGWQELERRLPAAERIGNRREASRCLAGGPYDLIVSEAALPDGGPYGLLGTLLGRHYDTTVVVHFRLQGSERWLKLFADGEFDLQAEPMTGEQFFRWLEG